MSGSKFQRRYEPVQAYRKAHCACQYLGLGSIGLFTASFLLGRSLQAGSGTGPTLKSCSKNDDFTSIALRRKIIVQRPVKSLHTFAWDLVTCLMPVNANNWDLFHRCQSYEMDACYSAAPVCGCTRTQEKTFHLLWGPACYGEISRSFTCFTTEPLYT